MADSGFRLGGFDYLTSASDDDPCFGFRCATMLLVRERDRNQQVVDAPVECVHVLEWHLQHRHAVAGRRACRAGQHLTLEHAARTAAAGALGLDAQRHAHVDQLHRCVRVALT
ncbi:hypothetical protein WL90_22590 [Burkholderia cenocepacia]|nr:hypothetical protein WL90_22590 [Burkholderia cenocepacia]KWF60372.1 hypothetical protein WL89_15625 [Burkholderia cenocepacia]